MSEIPMYPDEIAACSDGPEKGVCPLCKRVVNGARLDGEWRPKRGDDEHARSCVYAYEPNRSAISRGNAVDAPDPARANDNAPAELAADVLMERDTYRRALEDIEEDARLWMQTDARVETDMRLLGIRVVAGNALKAYPRKSDDDGK